LNGTTVFALVVARLVDDDEDDEDADEEDADNEEEVDGCDNDEADDGEEEEEEEEEDEDEDDEEEEEEDGAEEAEADAGIAFAFFSAASAFTSSAYDSNLRNEAKSRKQRYVHHTCAHRHAEKHCDVEFSPAVLSRSFPDFSIQRMSQVCECGPFLPSDTKSKKVIRTARKMVPDSFNTLRILSVHAHIILSPHREEGGRGKHERSHTQPGCYSVQEP
jgi:hypothetical protein